MSIDFRQQRIVAAEVLISKIKATNRRPRSYDYDGNPVASEGDQMELGGGGVDSGLVDGHTCGADSAWIVNR